MRTFVRVNQNAPHNKGKIGFIESETADNLEAFIVFEQDEYSRSVGFIEWEYLETDKLIQDEGEHFFGPEVTTNQ